MLDLVLDEACVFFDRLLPCPLLTHLKRISPDAAALGEALFARAVGLTRDEHHPRPPYIRVLGRVAPLAKVLVPWPDEFDLHVGDFAAASRFGCGAEEIGERVGALGGIFGGCV